MSDNQDDIDETTAAMRKGMADGTDTPITDEAEWQIIHQWVVDVEVARHLERKLAAAIKQRDEARREVCNQTTFYHPYLTEGKEVAAKRGWDCYEGGGA